MERKYYKSSLKKRFTKEHRIVSPPALVEAFRFSTLHRLNLTMIDQRYKAVPIGLFEDMMVRSTVDKIKYTQDTRDCDDFAVILKGELARDYMFNGCGIVMDTSGGHAYNAILTYDKNGRLKFLPFEPQNDKFIYDIKGMYLAEQGSILI